MTCIKQGNIASLISTPACYNPSSFHTSLATFSMTRQTRGHTLSEQNLGHATLYIAYEHWSNAFNGPPFQTFKCNFIQKTTLFTQMGEIKKVNSMRQEKARKVSIDDFFPPYKTLGFLCSLSRTLEWPKWLSKQNDPLSGTLECPSRMVHKLFI